MVSILQIAHAPGAVGGTLGKVQKPFEFLMFPAWDPLSPAHGFPNPLTVIENTSKSIVKPSKTSYSVRAHGYGPWPCVGDAPEEDVNPNAESLRNVVKTKGSAFALA